jgi:hypothetical protein
MYQIAPLLLILTLFVPWTSPADPGNRIAAANAGDGLAAQILIYHQAALAYVWAHPMTNGVVTPGALPSSWTTTGIASCAKLGIVVTYASIPSSISKPAVAAAMGRLWGSFPLTGQANSGVIINPYTGTALAIPCAVPDQTPVVYSQVGG